MRAADDIHVRDPYTDEPAEFLFAAKDNRGLPGRFGYWRGSGGHVFLDQPPANLADHYAGGYQEIPDSEDALAAMARDEAYRLEPIKNLVATGRFLEIGPWIGLVAYSALRAGYEVHALELDRRCVDLLNRVGVQATETGDPARVLADTGERYDVIGLWHSIEHLFRPWEVIEAAAKALNPGGVLLIAAPNPESAQLRTLGRHWLHLDAPRHLHLMPIAAFEEIGARNGLTTVLKTSDDRLGGILDRDGWMFELRRRVGNLPLLRSVAQRLFARRLARRHRRPGAIDGAGFTLIMQRPLG